MFRLLTLHVHHINTIFCWRCSSLAVLEGLVFSGWDVQNWTEQKTVGSILQWFQPPVLDTHVATSRSQHHTMACWGSAFLRARAKAIKRVHDCGASDVENVPRVSCRDIFRKKLLNNHVMNPDFMMAAVSHDGLFVGFKGIGRCIPRSFRRWSSYVL